MQNKKECLCQHEFVFEKMQIHRNSGILNGILFELKNLRFDLVHQAAFAQFTGITRVPIQPTLISGTV